MPTALESIINFTIPRMTGDEDPEVRRAIEALKRALASIENNFTTLFQDMTTIEGDITTLQAGGFQSWDLRKTAAGTHYVITTSGGNFIVVTAGTGPTNVTLPDPSANTTKAFAVASQSGTVNVVRFGSEEINAAAASYVLSVGERVILVTDGTDWFVLAT